MHIFVAGTTGWVGSAVTDELLKAGHQVTGLACSNDKATVLAATGANVLRATHDDLDTLRATAAAADAVIHTVFNHDVSKFAENADQDRRVIEALGSALEGSQRPLPVTSSGLSGLPRGATEADIAGPAGPRKRDREHFGWFANVVGADMAASSARTQSHLGWKPSAPSLITDIEQSGYYA
ncbi:NAD(P)H-binding protein [Pseudomonas sp. R2.Fl]|nr:NAD(P)H-binding protein [Pseudomonas sp. R2.Fl]